MVKALEKLNGVDVAQLLAIMSKPDASSMATSPMLPLQSVISLLTLSSTPTMPLSWAWQPAITMGVVASKLIS